MHVPRESSVGGCVYPCGLSRTTDSSYVTASALLRVGKDAEQRFCEESSPRPGRGPSVYPPGTNIVLEIVILLLL